MVFSQKRRIFLLKYYYETKSYKKVQNQFQEAYPDENVISDSSVQRLVKKFEETGTVRDLLGCGQRTKQTEEMKEAEAILMGSSSQCSHLYGFVRTSRDFF